MQIYNDENCLPQYVEYESQPRERIKRYYGPYLEQGDYSKQLQAEDVDENYVKNLARSRNKSGNVTYRYSDPVLGRQLPKMGYRGEGKQLMRPGMRSISNAYGEVLHDNGDDNEDIAFRPSVEEYPLKDKANPMEKVFDDPSAHKSLVKKRLKGAYTAIHNKMQKGSNSKKKNQSSPISENKSSKKREKNSSGSSLNKPEKNIENAYGNDKYSFMNSLRTSLVPSKRYPKYEDKNTLTELACENNKIKEGVKNARPDDASEYSSIWDYALGFIRSDESDHNGDDSRVKYMATPSNQKKKYHYSNLFDKFSAPALDRGLRQRHYYRKPFTSWAFQLPNDVILEVGGIGDEKVAEELFYNSRTGEFETCSSQLERRLPNKAIAGIERNRRQGDYDVTYLMSNINAMIKKVKLFRILFAPIDALSLAFPTLQNAVIVLELVIFIWLLYEISLLVDAICMIVRTFCTPFLTIGKIMGKVV